VALADFESVSDADQEPPSGCPSLGWLDGMIQTLPDGYRQAVQMAEVEYRSQQEVAGRLGLSLSGAKSRIQRGRAMLKDVLQRCCSFELDARGQVMGCDPKPNQQVCRDCGE
jgi:RNA polymerase sigma-70 factor, ECF subfamily